MTLLLNPETIAAVKARSQQTRDEMPGWAKRMNGERWSRAYAQACDLLAEQVAAASKRDDGTGSAAVLLQDAFDLVGFAMVKFADPTLPDPRSLVRQATDETLHRIWAKIDRSIQLINAEAEVALRQQAEQEYSRLLAEHQVAMAQERDMAAQVADAAYAEAAAARQEVAELEAQLKAEREAHRKTHYDLSKALEKAKQPSSELVALRGRVVDLEHQNKQLSQASRNVSQPEVTQMPISAVTSCTFDTLIEAMSFCAATRTPTFRPQIVAGKVVAAGGADLTAALNRWSNQVADPREHVRGVVAARLERAV